MKFLHEIVTFTPAFFFIQDSEELDPSESSEELEPGVLWYLAQKPTCVRNLLVIFDMFDGFIHGAIVLQKLLCQLNLLNLQIRKDMKISFKKMLLVAFRYLG